MDGKLCDQIVSILINPASNYSYVNHNLVDNYGLNKQVHAESWLVQLATGTKKRVHHRVRACSFELNGMPTTSHLNVLPLGHIVIFWVWIGYIFTEPKYCYDKDIEHLDGNGEQRIL